MREVDEMRADLKYNQKNMLKARTATEAIAEKVQTTEGQNKLAI